jgi:hypothetical protein
LIDASELFPQEIVMHQGFLPNFALLFRPVELTDEVLTVEPVRFRQLMIRQTLEAYGHWLDRDTVRRMLKELQGRAPPP